MICDCPQADAIQTIPSDECVENLGQIQRYGVQRRKSGATENWINIATTDPELLATWTALKAAADSTKVQFSPIFGNPTTEPGEAIEFGGGNETPGGIPIVVGRQPTTFEAVFYRLKQYIVKALKSYECEVAISVFLVTEAGQIAAIADDPQNPTMIKGIPIRGYFVSDKGLGGREAPDVNNVKWQFEPNWSDNLVLITPSDFDPISAL